MTSPTESKYLTEPDMTTLRFLHFELKVYPKILVRNSVILTKKLKVIISGSVRYHDTVGNLIAVGDHVIEISQGQMSYISMHQPSMGALDSPKYLQSLSIGRSSLLKRKGDGSQNA